MSWHCNCENSTDESIPWVHIHVAPIDGGIPLTIVLHTECLRKAICEDKEGWTIEGMESVDEALTLLRDEAQEHLNIERERQKEADRR